MLTLYMQQVLHYSAMKTGVGYLAVAGTAIVWSAVAAQLVNRLGVKPVLVAGMAFLSAGLIYFTQVSVDGTYVGDLLPGFLLIAVGLGFSFVPISIAALAGVQAVGGGSRVRPAEHVAADRRRARHRRAHRHRDAADRRLDRFGIEPGGRADRRIPDGVLRSGGRRARRHPRRARRRRAGRPRCGFSRGRGRGRAPGPRARGARRWAAKTPGCHSSGRRAIGGPGDEPPTFLSRLRRAERRRRGGRPR